jgi:hypothetical protein
MDAFERVVAQILNHQGYWSRTEFKVKLTKEKKREIGVPNSPRWELDVLGYKPATNEILVAECKSYLDSPGLGLTMFDPNSKHSKRLKLFTRPTVRQVVLGRLQLQLLDEKLCRPDPKISLALFAGKTIEPEAQFEDQAERDSFWKFFGPSWIREKLIQLSTTGYDSEIASVVSKLILRGSIDPDTNLLSQV